jgi:hypothetical protein
MRGSLDVRSTEVAARCTGDGKLLPSNVHFPDASHHVLEVRRQGKPISALQSRVLGLGKVGREDVQRSKAK